MSPQLQSAQLAQYQHNAPQHFSNELEGSNPHGQPGMTNVREMRWVGFDAAFWITEWLKAGCQFT
jgi:hypothetical protein